jgi:hypothetical protein
MGIIIVSSAPIELLKDYELETGEESTEKIAHVYVPARRYDPPAMKQDDPPPTNTQRPPMAPRRYEPRPDVYRHGKRCMLHLVPNQQKEEI